MNVLSLFDGKSSGYTAMELAGLPVTRYYSSEIDKYAIKVSNAIHPNQTRLGDVTKWREWDIDWETIDLIIAGSPCQGFSRAGSMLEFDDPRSKLFFEFMDIVNHTIQKNRNVNFFLENVRMSKWAFQQVNEFTGCNGVMINSNLVSAQNRERFYWASWDFSTPDDKGIYLVDILESKESLPDGYEYKSKSKCVRVGGLGSKLGDKHEWDSPYCMLRKRGNNNGGVRALDGKTPCVTTSSWEHNVSVFDGLNKRRFTPRECFRLQTTPERYIDKILACGVSNSQLYKIAGNGWTDEVIAHIFMGLNGR